MSTEATRQADLVALAEETQKHLKEAGHDVEVTTNTDLTAFDVVEAGKEDEGMVCRVQSVRDDFWEVVRPGGETLTGIGGRETFFTMVERVVAASIRRAA